MKMSNYFAKEKMDDASFIQTYIEKLSDLTDEDICWANSDLNEDNENVQSLLMEMVLSFYATDLVDMKDYETYLVDKEYQSSSDGKKVIKIGTCGSADTFRAVQKVLDDENSGIYLDVVVFDAYNLPNEALNNGEIDLNSFQHKAYLKNECEAQGYDLTAIGDTSSAPLTLYSKKVDSLKALKELAGKKED